MHLQILKFLEANNFLTINWDYRTVIKFSCTLIHTNLKQTNICIMNRLTALTLNTAAYYIAFFRSYKYNYIIVIYKSLKPKTSTFLLRSKVLFCNFLIIIIYLLP